MLQQSVSLWKQEKKTTYETPAKERNAKNVIDRYPHGTVTHISSYLTGYNPVATPIAVNHLSY